MSVDKLIRCDGCGVHVRRESSSCPFCGRAATSLHFRRGLAALAGAAAFVSGIGCAYGCPPEGCLDPVDASADRTGDARDLADASVAPADAAIEDAGFVDAPSEAASDAAPDAVFDAPSDG